MAHSLFLMLSRYLWIVLFPPLLRCLTLHQRPVCCDPDVPPACRPLPPLLPLPHVFQFTNDGFMSPSPRPSQPTPRPMTPSRIIRLTILNYTLTLRPS